MYILLWPFFSCDKGGDCECLCTAVAAFGEQCNQAGAPAKWRNPRFCRMYFFYLKEKNLYRMRDK